MGTQTNNPPTNPENQPDRSRTNKPGMPGNDMEPSHDPSKITPEAGKPNAGDSTKHV